MANLQCTQDPQNQVTPISGDLLTIQHLHSLRTTWAEESTPWGCVQFMVLVMGLFHLKIACADVIYQQGHFPRLWISGTVHSRGVVEEDAQ